MAAFVIGDLHLSLGEDKPMDVFPGWDGYEEKLRQNWLRLVSEKDTVVIAGDISWAMKLEDTKTDFDFLHSLPGRKVLLKGNHDYWWSTKTKILRFFEGNGFTDFSLLHNCAVEADEIALCGTRGWVISSDLPEDQKILSRELGRLEFSLSEAGKTGRKPVVILHYPPYFDGYACEQAFTMMRSYGVEDCYFGHIHGAYAAKKARISAYGGIRLHLIAGDQIGFCPQKI